MNFEAPILELRNVSVPSGSQYETALDGISFELCPGELLMARLERENERVPLADTAEGLVPPSAGTVTFAPAHGARSSQLRSIFRYQLSPPRNPERSNSPASLRRRRTRQVEKSSRTPKARRPDCWIRWRRSAVSVYCSSEARIMRAQGSAKNRKKAGFLSRGHY